jgi:hypothetical protein
MMKFLCKLTKTYGVKTMVSLNPIMGDHFNGVNTLL